MKKFLLGCLLVLPLAVFAQQMGNYPVWGSNVTVTVISNTNVTTGTALTGFETNDFSRFTMLIRNTGTVPVRIVDHIDTDSTSPFCNTNAIVIPATNTVEFGYPLAPGEVYNYDKNMLTPFALHARGETNTTAAGKLNIDFKRWK